ncbi:hypothetical protein D7V94_16505 [Parablautia intestinalis]|uniref:Uncharacterized protein n=1 Tax=Parablautia intestinalis TaxID=2320100 RepID=A0A3A9AQH1_9FIRM|nr:hypothetical protein [Parablautia intestinalis]RKI89783.1 hypothetical protein D7V94_16505 [Parablautia intestinalis]
MSVNGVTGASDVYGTTYSAQAKGTETKSESQAETSKGTGSTSAGAVYEPSKQTTGAVNKKYKPDTNLIAKMKADADARTSQLQSLVEKMLTKQGETYGKANDIWSILSSGNFTVDPATKLQAQADIADDGYWGVSQTSQRILDFAKALTGGDPSKIEKMRSAFEKGYKMAEKKWGGSLPDISQKTFDAVQKGFDDMAKDAGINIEEN